MLTPLALRALPYASLLLLGGLWRCSDVRRQRAIGAAQHETATLRDSLRVAQRAGRRLDSIYVRDTVRVTRRIESTRTLIDTLRLSMRSSAAITYLIIRR